MMGTIVGAFLAVILINGVTLSVFLQLRPWWGLAWGCAVATGFVWLHFRPTQTWRRRAAVVRLSAPIGSGKLLLAGIASSFIVVLGISAVLQALFSEMETAESSAMQEGLIQYQSTWNGWVAIAVLVALVLPVIEEFCFRGYIQHMLEKKIGPVAGIAITAALFALVHLRFPSWPVGAIALALGAQSGVAVYLFRSVWAGFAIHASWNFAMVLGTRVDVPVVSTSLELGAHWSAAVGATAAVLGLLGWIAVFQRRDKELLAASA